MSTKGYMSDAKARYETASTALGARAQEAITEATRILAATETGSDWNATINACKPAARALPSASAWRHNGTQDTRDFPVARIRAQRIKAWWPVANVEAEAIDALADALFAALPVLDALAADAPCFTFGILARNRATDDALGGR